MQTRLWPEIQCAPIHLIDRARGFMINRRNKLLSRCHSSVRFMPQSYVTNLSGRAGAIRVGEGTVIRSNLMIFAHGGDIEIGDWCYLGDEGRIWSAASIRIGHRVLISHQVEIHDTAAHAVSARERHLQYKELLQTGHQKILPNVKRDPILIGNDVWIGFRTTILRGVTIGDGAIVAANSTVLKNVPPWTLVGGSPARVLRHLDPEYPAQTGPSGSATESLAPPLASE